MNPLSYPRSGREAREGRMSRTSRNHYHNHESKNSSLSDQSFFHKWLEEGVDLKSVEPMFEKRDGSDALMKFEKLSVSGELTDKYVCQTIAYYQQNFHLAQNGVSFVQLVFADHNDHYPDHPEYDHKVVPQKIFKKLILN